jgi:hypothetical protein
MPDDHDELVYYLGLSVGRRNVFRPQPSILDLKTWNTVPSSRTEAIDISHRVAAQSKATESARRRG